MLLLLIGWTRLTQSPAWGKLRMHPHQRSRTCGHHRPPFLRLLSQKWTKFHKHPAIMRVLWSFGCLVFILLLVQTNISRELKCCFCQQNVRYKTDSRPWLHCLRSDWRQTWSVFSYCFHDWSVKHGGSWSKSKFSESRSILVIHNSTGNLKVHSLINPTTPNNPFSPPVLKISPVERRVEDECEETIKSKGCKLIYKNHLLTWYMGFFHRLVLPSPFWARKCDTNQLLTTAQGFQNTYPAEISYVALSPFKFAVREGSF